MTSTQTDTAPTKRGGRFRKRPAEVWQFTAADLDYLNRLTKRMIAIGAWESIKRWTCDKTENGEVVEADYWYITVWGADHAMYSPPAIERHDGMYFLTAGDFTELAKGKTVGSVTKRFAKALTD